MSVTVDYLPVAVATGANVESQVDFDGSGHQLTGFTAGEAMSAQMNKVWRQSSMVAAAIANFIANTLNINVLDDGNISNLITILTEAIAAAAGTVTAPEVITVPFSATPVFNADAGNPLVAVFELTLAGNVTSSTLTNLNPGQIIVVSVIQPGGGGDTFTPPSNLPMAPISAAANSKSTQVFAVLTGSVIVPIGPLTVD